MLYLQHWKEIKEIYDNTGELSAVNELSEHAESVSLLSGRELELWKPIFSLAKFFDQHVKAATSQTTQTTLSSLVLKLALEKAEEKKTENMTETGDCILIKTLLDMVNADSYYKVKEIRDETAKHFDEEQKWLNTKWVGRALKRLGFTDKRRVGTGYEYRLTKQGVRDVAERLGIQQSTTIAKEIPEAEILIQNLRKFFSKGTEEEFESLIKRINPSLTDREAATLFNQLVEAGHLARDAERTVAVDKMKQPTTTKTSQRQKRMEKPQLEAINFYYKFLKKRASTPKTMHQHRLRSNSEVATRCAQIS